MSIVSGIKDSLELLNNVYDSVSGELTIFKLIQEIFVYMLVNLKNILYYFLSFQWIRDFSFLPVIIPQISFSILKENFFIENPSSNLFSFLEASSYSNDKFLIGFLNSFFLSLPITTSHILATRTLLVQGITAGMTSFFGIILGQWVFITCILFGLRIILVPWLSLEPFSYFLGLILIFKTVYSMVREPVQLIQPTAKKRLLSFFMLHFALAWCEQTCIFQYLGNVTLSADPTHLENFYSNRLTESFLLHFNYSLGLLFGSIFFSGSFALIFISLQNQLFLKKIFTTNKINFSFLTLSIAFTLSSIPFYGLDYLFTGPLGFISQDKSLQKTILAQTNLKDTLRLLGSSSAIESPDKSGFETLDTDISSFDRGVYLNPNSDQSLEDLNYQGEYHWTRRTDHVSTMSDPRFKTWSQRIFGLGENKTPKKINNFLENSNEPEKIPNQEYSDSLSQISPQVQTAYLYNQTNQDFSNPTNILNTFIDFNTYSFSNLFIKKLSSPQQNPALEKKIKEKYYSNPVYQFLLNRDIDFFIKRQPKSFILNSEQEKDLFTKRLILANYYDSLRDYSQIPKKEEFYNFFNGSKSYADRVYNQQFKGTLRVVRRLFSLSVDDAENKNLQLVLKYDQPLYVFKKENGEQQHEELKTYSKDQKPFLEFTNPIPFYAGWDEDLRKLVLTNRLSPRYLVGTEFKVTDTLAKNLGEKTSKKLIFTAWPLSKEILEKPKSQSNIPYTTLFDSFSDPINQNVYISKIFNSEPAQEIFWDFSSLPSNLKRVRTAYNVDMFKNENNILAPNRGGFLWPGTQKLKFKFEFTKFSPKIVKNTQKSF